MKTDKVYITGMEVEIFSNIFKIKIILYTRNINEKNLLKTDDDKVESIILENKYEGNFALILDKYPNEIYNHYSSLRHISNKNRLNDERLNNIKNRIINPLSYTDRVHIPRYFIILFRVWTMSGELKGLIDNLI